MNDEEFIIMDWCEFNLDHFKNVVAVRTYIKLSKLEVISQVLCGLQHLHKHNISKLLILNFTILFLFST